MGCKATETVTYDAGEGAAAQVGTILGYVGGAGPNTVGRASLSTPAAGVAIQGAAPGAQVTMISQGLGLVRLDGTDPVITEGQAIFVTSDTAPASLGLGKIGPPERSMSLVGYVTDTTGYNAVTNPLVTALIMPESQLNRIGGRVAIGGEIVPATGIAIGENATVATGDTDGIAIGRGATTTAANQCVIGSDLAPITDFRVVGDAGGAGGISLQALATPGAADSTGLLLVVDRGGVVTAGNAVTLGAADSGGAGFKALRVPN